MKASITKNTAKQQRERQVLFGLIEHYIVTGKPVGSSTLQGESFQKLSSATIRNYFAELEEQGYLKQLHTSGGRVPTEKAFRLYADGQKEHPLLSKEARKTLDLLSERQDPEINHYLQKACESLSDLTCSAAFIMAPRFDQDFALDIKLVMLDMHRALTVIITNFGKIRTEVLLTDLKLTSFRTKRIESYFIWRLTGHDEPDNLEPEELELAKRWFSEVMVRYVVDYSNFTDDEVYRTGLSKLLSYPEIDSSATLAKTLSLFENVHGMRLLLKDSYNTGHLKVWIGKDLIPYSQGEPDCAVVCVPYTINQKPVGAVGILGPMRLDYPQIYGQLLHFSDVISEELTRSVFKYRITYRQPMENLPELEFKERLMLEQIPNRKEGT
ncbi:MAG: heat-inducible transcriptional repressor HrcA [Chlamydiia bacterium]|nr:heat-inducible transcriptional repressor HrcA [Chlamydiia bacterium]